MRCTKLISLRNQTENTNGEWQNQKNEEWAWWQKTCGKSVKNCIFLFPFLIISPIFFLSIVCRLHLLYNTHCTLWIFHPLARFIFKFVY